MVGIVGLHCGDCLVASWGVLGYMVESVGLYGGVLRVNGGVLDHMLGYIEGSVGLDDGVLGYMMESVGLYGGKC